MEEALLFQKKKKKLVFYSVMLAFMLLFPLASPLNDEGKALMSIKASFNNIANVLLDWDDVHNDDFCSWRSVFCDNITLSVVSLNLSNLNLGGEISPAIGDLKNLQSISLQGNRLTGKIPEVIGLMQALVVLDLSENKLVGPIPPILGNLSYTGKLYLHGNKLTGPIPPELGNKSKLSYLKLQKRPKKRLLSM